MIKKSISISHDKFWLVFEHLEMFILTHYSLYNDNFIKLQHEKKDKSCQW